MLVYKFDVMEALREAGYTALGLKKDHILGDATMQSLRTGEMVGMKSLETICRLLDMQPGNIIKYVEDGHDQK